MTPLYAAIGHQDGWPRISDLFHALRDDGEQVPMEEVRSIIPWIPPRVAGRFEISSSQGFAVPSIYVDTFLTPDDLGRWGDRGVIGRIRDAIAAARREGAKVAALGGFTSILAELGGGFDSEKEGIAITTGNSLTAALIVEGVQKAIREFGLGKPLGKRTILVIGATGDIGSAVARWFDRRCARLLLCARHMPRLARLQSQLSGPSEIVDDLPAALAAADIVISVASMAEAQIDPRQCRPDAFICDAGYPKNLHSVAGRRCFWGGLGVVEGGLRGVDRLFDLVNPNREENVVHGCLLEGALLAMSRRFEPFSTGRGRITPERLDEIWDLATSHGIRPAPLHDGFGRWDEQAAQGAA